MDVSHILKKKGHLCYSINANQPLSEAITLMVEHNIGSLVVKDGDELVSIVTERDVTRAVCNHGSNLEQVFVKDVMASELIVCKSDDSIDEAMELMAINQVNRWIRHLPVVDKGKLVGLISIVDIVQALLTKADLENKMLKNYIKNWPEENEENIPKIS